MSGPAGRGETVPTGRLTGPHRARILSDGTMFTVQAGPIPVPRKAVPEFLRGISRKTVWTFYVLPEGGSVELVDTEWGGGTRNVYRLLMRV